MSEEKYPLSLLFVEDEASIRQNYVEYLQEIFENVYEAQDGEEAYEVYKKTKPDIMIVDIYLPKVSGIEFLKKVRHCDHETRVIMLTAHTDTALLLEAAELKLTKYLTKPIGRKSLYEAIELAIEESSRFRILPINTIAIDDEFSWEEKVQELRKDNKVVTLTKKEQKFLALLLMDVSRVFTYDEIFDDVWGYEKMGTTDALKSLVKSLRKKMPKECIKNIFGIGYKLEIQKK